MMGWLRHAFAIQPEAGQQLTPAEEALVDRFCRAVVRRRLTAAALAALETLRPLSGVAAQGIHFFTPLLSLLASPEQINRLAEFLQRPDALQILCERLERLEANRPEETMLTGSTGPEASDPSGCSEAAGQADRSAAPPGGSPVPNPQARFPDGPAITDQMDQPCHSGRLGHETPGQIGITPQTDRL